MGQKILKFIDIACNSTTNHCALTVNGSQLANNERYFVSVMASITNVNSNGSSTVFPNESELT